MLWKQAEDRLFELCNDNFLSRDNWYEQKRQLICTQKSEILSLKKHTYYGIDVMRSNNARHASFYENMKHHYSK